MSNNKKNLIIAGVISSLILIYLTLFNLSPKSQDSLIAKCDERPISLDKLKLCLEDAQKLIQGGDNTKILGKMNECVLEMKNLYLKKSGYEVPDNIKTDFTFQGYFNNKIVPVKSEVDGIHITLSRLESNQLSSCIMSVLDPKISLDSISFIPSEKKNIIVCFDPVSNQEFAYFSSDWGDEISKELESNFNQLKKDLSQRKILNNIPPSNESPVDN